MLIVTFLALLVVACGVPDPVTQPAADRATTPTLLAAAPAASADSTPTATTGVRCPDLLDTVATMDRATLEQCVAVETTALAQVAPTCPADFDLSTVTDDAIAGYCGGLRETEEVLRILSTDLTPTVPRPTETPFAQTPLPLGFIPDRFKVVEPVPLEDMVGLPFFRDASVWQLGAISDISGYGYNSVWLWAKPPGSGAPHAMIGIAIMGTAKTNEGPQYRMIWEAPEDVGAITITGISGVRLEREQAHGLVAFTTSSGRSGTFDLATGQWVLAP